MAPTLQGPLTWEGMGKSIGSFRRLSLEERPIDFYTKSTFKLIPIWDQYKKISWCPCSCPCPNLCHCPCACPCTVYVDFRIHVYIPSLSIACVQIAWKWTRTQVTTSKWLRTWTLGTESRIFLCQDTFSKILMLVKIIMNIRHKSPPSSFWIGCSYVRLSPK